MIGVGNVVGDAKSLYTCKMVARQCMTEVSIHVVAARQHTIGLGLCTHV